jgi:hypothetical protein
MVDSCTNTLHLELIQVHTVFTEAWCAQLLFRGCSEQAHVSGKQHPIEGMVTFDEILVV